MRCFHPALIGQVQSELNQAPRRIMPQQFVADLKREMKVKRNESAIESLQGAAADAAAADRRRLTLACLLPKSSLFVLFGGVTADAHRQAA